MSGRKISDATRGRALVVFGETGSVRETARRMGVHAATISRWLRDWRLCDHVSVLVELGRRRALLAAQQAQERALAAIHARLDDPQKPLATRELIEILNTVGPVIDRDGRPEPLHPPRSQIL